MTTIYVLSGIPGSGKTTLSKELAEAYNAVVRSYDDMPNANTEESMDGSVKQAWMELMLEDLKSGKSVICDGVNTTIKDRLSILSVLSEIQCKKILIIKAVPLQICLERNRQRESRLPDFVIEQCAQRMQLPLRDEGWDKIYVCKD